MFSVTLRYAVHSLQPSAEIIAFRIGELIGLSKWRACYQGIGMDRKCIDLAVEKSGMFLVQVERFVRVLAMVLYEVLHISISYSIFSNT